MYILPSHKTFNFETKLWKIEERNSFETVRKIVHYLESFYIIWKIFNHPERSKSVQTVMKVLRQFNSFFFCFTRIKLSVCAKTFWVAMLPCYAYFCASACTVKLSQRIKWIVITFTFYLLIKFQTLPGLRSRPWVPLVTILRGNLKKNIVFRSSSNLLLL